MEERKMRPRPRRSRRKVCKFCVEKATGIKHQRDLAVAIKRARVMALLPFAGERF